MNETERKIIEIYCDESGHELLNTIKEKRTNQYFGIGAIKFQDADREKFKNELKSIQKKYHIPWEIKWRKLAPTNISFYKALIDWFINSDIQFRLVRIDTANLDLEFWHNRDPELGFYKFTIFQFEHAFFKASIPSATYKDLFDRDRAERIDWIEYTLTSGYAEVYLKRDNRQRKLHILLDNYVVVINLAKNDEKRAFFVTAYLADTEKHINLLKTNELVYKPK